MRYWHFVKEYITKEQLLMGRDVKYPLTPEMQENLSILHLRLNSLAELMEHRGALPEGFCWEVSSGYRPGRFNFFWDKLLKKWTETTPKSRHKVCKAVDVKDPDGHLDRLLDDNPMWLEWCGLSRENPKKTVGWCHLDVDMRGGKYTTFT